MLTAFRAVKHNTIAMIMLAMTFGTTPETKRIFRKPSTTISSFIPGIDGLQVVSVNTQHTNRIAGPATATGDRGGERERDLLGNNVHDGYACAPVPSLSGQGLQCSSITIYDPLMAVPLC